MKSLSNQDLAVYQVVLDDPSSSATQMFDGLKKIYKRYFQDQEAMAMMESNLEFLPLTEEIDAQHNKWEEHSVTVTRLNEEIDVKGDLLKTINSEHLSLPELKAHIERQEAYDKELREVLAITSEHIENGQRIQSRNDEMLKKIEEIIVQATKSVRAEEDRYLRLLVRRFWFAKFQSRLLTILPAFGFSVLLDWLSQSSENTVLASKDVAAVFQNHYTFLIVFFLLELFVIDGIKDKIAHYFAKRYCAKSFAYISALLPDSQKRMTEAEDKHGISPHELMDKLIELGSKIG